MSVVGAGRVAGEMTSQESVPLRDGFFSVLLLLGSGFIALSLVLPHPSGSHDGLLAAIAWGMAAGSALCWALSPRIPVLASHAILAAAALATIVPGAVAAVVAHQIACGVDIPNDGELSKPGFSEYVRERIRGFELREVDITGDPELEARYREWLPVVEIDGERAFVYHVFADALVSKLDAAAR